jgi:hypothetical protein
VTLRFRNLRETCGWLKDRVSHAGPAGRVKTNKQTNTGARPVIDKRHVDCDRNCLKWTVIDNVPQSDCDGQFQSDCDRHNGCHVNCDTQTSARLG